MNRAAAVALALLAAAGCTSAPPPLTEVDIYWEFDRHTWINGQAGTVPYDVNVNNPPVATGPCPQSGVSFVRVTDAAGNPLTGDIPCANQGVQGVALTGFTGPNTYVVTGYRTGVPAPLYTGSVTVNVVAGQPPPFYGTAIAAGIPSMLTIDAILADASFPSGAPTCGAAGIQEFDSWLEDGYGTVVWADYVPCGPSDLPGISYGFVDRDTLRLWMDAVDLRGTTPAIIWSRCGFDFGHYTTGEDRFGLNLPLGVCTQPPPPAGP